MTVPTTIEAIAAEVVEQNKLYDNGEMDKAFWLGQQNRLKAMKELDPTLTNEAIGELVGKQKAWVGKVLAFNGIFDNTPAWGNKPQAQRNVNTTKAVLKDPERRKEALASLTSKEREAVAEEIMEEPQVAASVIRKATTVTDTDAKRQIKEGKEKVIKAGGPRPLSAFFFRLVEKMRDWKRDTEWIGGELDGLLDGQVDDVLGRHRELRDALNVNIAKLEERLSGDDDVIEGRVSRDRPRLVG